MGGYCDVKFIKSEKINTCYSNFDLVIHNTKNNNNYKILFTSGDYILISPNYVISKN